MFSVAGEKQAVIQLACAYLYKISFYGRVNAYFHINEGECP